MSSSGDAEYDYRSRFEQFKAVEAQKDNLIIEVLDRLEFVERERNVIKRDLEVQQDARRRLQEDISKHADLERTMNQGRFIVVLIDADADIYLFHEKFIVRGVKGGQEAAEELMVKVRQYLQSIIKDASVIEIVVKAYANFDGLAQAWVRNGEIKVAMSLNQFVIGFNRRYPLFDFINVGPGKEEADNKFRNVLDIYYVNPQCQHIILGCYHDQGYVPFLRKFHQAPSVTEKITLLKTGPPANGMESLGFKTTTEFNSIFSSASSNLTLISPTIIKSFSVVNSERLAPIIYDISGQRIDKDLNVENTLLARMKKLNLCSRHYLRGNCPGCKYSHDYPRPLNPAEYDAVWLVARKGFCYETQRKKICQDDRCIYRHQR